MLTGLLCCQVPRRTGGFVRLEAAHNLHLLSFHSRQSRCWSIMSLRKHYERRICSACTSATLHKGHRTDHRVEPNDCKNIHARALFSNDWGDKQLDVTMAKLGEASLGLCGRNTICCCRRRCCCIDTGRIELFRTPGLPRSHAPRCGSLTRCCTKRMPLNKPCLLPRLSIS